MIKVGLTGGIGSGKTTVCSVWEKSGAYVINADDLAKKIMTTNSVVKQKLTDAFGIETFHQDGTLNRKYLANQAFEQERVNELNNIVHPRMPGYVQDEIQTAKKQGFSLLVYEAALLLQNVDAYNLDYIVLVLADKKKRIQWVEQRDEATEESIKERMNKQTVFEELISKADFIIQNEESLAELEQKAESLYYKILDAK